MFEARRAGAVLALLTVHLASPASAAEIMSDCRASDLVPRNGSLEPLYSRQIQQPEVQTEAEVEVGTSMISVVRADVYPVALRLKADINYVGAGETAGLNAHIPKGKLPVGFSNATAILYDASAATASVGKRSSGDLPVSIGLTRDPLKPPRIVVTKPASLMKAGVTYSDNLVGIEFDQLNCVAHREARFRRELVFSGVSKGTVSLLYREYQDDLARPAFSQELSYDLAEGDEIGFRGARFKVLKATNTSIRYVVLKPLSSE